MRKFILGVAVLAATSLSTGAAWSQDLGPIGPSPYEAVDGWLKPFDPGFTFGGNVGVQPDTPNRIFILQRGSTRLPNPVPPGYLGYAASIGMVTQKGEGRVYKNVIFVVDGTGKMIEAWSQWDHLFARTDLEAGLHRIRISPYDRERRVWVIDESAQQIHVFSNDGKKLIMTLGEKNVAGNDRTHFSKPQDVAFLADGRVLVGDGLGNTRVVVLDAQGKYLTEFGTKGTGPGQFMTVHGVSTAPDGTVFVVDRDGRQVQLFKEAQVGSSKFDHVATWKGFELPLDVVANGSGDVWVSDLGKPKVIKFDRAGNRLYTWFWPTEGPDRFREMHTMIVDSAGNVYGSDNQVGRTQKLVPKMGADPKLLLKK
jgi:DNA-binding beta-propeller fold protein YncE